MDKFLARELIVEHLGHRDLIELVKKEGTFTIQVTSDLTLRLKGNRREVGIDVTVVEKGQPDKKVMMSLFGDFAITDFHHYL